MKLAATLTLVASSAFAGPVLQWGGSSAVLAPCSEADACVTVINRLTGSPDEIFGNIGVDGLTVQVHVLNGPGLTPDRVQIIAPVGWLVMPPIADIPEDAALVFKLFAPLMG